MFPRDPVALCVQATTVQGGSCQFYCFNGLHFWKEFYKSETMFQIEMHLNIFHSFLKKRNQNAFVDSSCHHACQKNMLSFFLVFAIILEFGNYIASYESWLFSGSLECTVDIYIYIYIYINLRAFLWEQHIRMLGNERPKSWKIHNKIASSSTSIIMLLSDHTTISEPWSLVNGKFWRVGAEKAPKEPTFFTNCKELTETGGSSFTGDFRIKGGKAILSAPSWVKPVFTWTVTPVLCMLIRSNTTYFCINLHWCSSVNKCTFGSRERSRWKHFFLNLSTKILNIITLLGKSFIPSSPPKPTCEISSWSCFLPPQYGNTPCDTCNCH